MDFMDAYHSGRRKLSIFRIIRRKNMLLSLKELTSVVRPLGEAYSGVRDVPVERIIGSESRSSDFSMGFLPIHKWMEQRWTRVQKLLLEDRIMEPIMLLEYGGCYFVRDGNHRVSIARTNKIEFLTAEVTLLKIPVDLPDNMNRDLIGVFQEKMRFQQETGIFDVIPEDQFRVQEPETWDRIRDSIFQEHRKLFITKNWYVPYDEQKY